MRFKFWHSDKSDSLGINYIFGINLYRGRYSGLSLDIFIGKHMFAFYWWRD